MVLLSASGMLTGGRVLHHLERLAPDHRNTVLLVGYQAAGTRGETLAAGSRSIKMFGEYVPVRSEIARIDGLSAHQGPGPDTGRAHPACTAATAINAAPAET